MGKMYEDWNKLFCDQMVEEIKKFEKCPTKEQLCIIKDLIEVTNGLQEMEMDGAIRRIAEDRYGYDSGTGRFREDGMRQFGRDAEMEFLEMFNAARGRGRGRRRDSRGRFIGNMADPRHMPSYYPGMDEGDYPWERLYYMMNDGKREYSADRFKREDGRDDGRDDEMYMLRQKDGMPIMTPYNAHDPHDIPKKLTKEEMEKWAKNLENEDGTDSYHFSKQQIEEAAKKVGVNYQEYGVDYLWLTANMLYSDYCDVVAPYGLQDKADFWAKMAEAFLDDSDFDGTGSEKLSIYYHMIAKHGK